MMKIFYLLLAMLLCMQSFSECKRTITSSRKTGSSSSSSYNTRRTSQSHTSRPATSRPATSRPVSNYDNTKLSYGNNNYQQKPSAPAPNKNQAPPPYSSVNNPSSISKNQAPPPYSSNPAPGHSSIQSANYPRQNYQNNNPTSRANAAPTYYQPGHVPAGATMYSGPPGVGHGAPNYYGGGGGGYGGGGYGGGGYGGGGYGGGGYHGPPMGAQAPPTYYSPGQLPPGAVFYPQKQNSGPGLGTGLIAGAVGGAILGHVLTPTHSREVVHTSSGSNAGVPASGDDKIIIINNGPPGSVTATGTGTQVIDANPGAVAPAPAPGGAHIQNNEQPVPLAPFQPGSTMEAQNPAPAQNNAGLAAVVPPVNAAANTDPAAAQPAPAPGSIACYPILVNQTDPADPTKVTQVEQVACYEVPAAPQNPPPAEQQQNAQMNNAQPDQVPLAPFAPTTTTENNSQRTSSATIAESAQIKQNGAINNTPLSLWSSLTFALFITFSKFLMS